MSRGPSQLPTRIRLVAWLALIVTSLVGFFAFHNAVFVVHPPAADDLITPAAPAEKDSSESLGDALFAAQVRTQLESNEGMRGPRSFVLFALSFVALMGVGSAVRLLWPVGVPREGMRRITGGTLLVAGVLRTLDGAMELAIDRRVGVAISKFPPGEGAPEALLQAMPTILSLVSVAWSFFVVALLIGAAQYLRSERVKRLIAEVDARTAAGPPTDEL